jgi:hypothetical protein
VRGIEVVPIGKGVFFVEEDESGNEEVREVPASWRGSVFRDESSGRSFLRW